MFGKNQVVKQDLKDDGSLAVKEIFHTIQGEGPLSGIPAVFVRLAGCNLKCWFCDTDFDNGMRSTVRAIIEDIEQKMGTSYLVVITGGEPFVQNIVPLCSQLLLQGFAVQIETAGTLWIDNFGSLINYPGSPAEARGCSIVVSPKTGKLHPMIHEYASAYKYIVGSQFDVGPDGLPLGSTQGKEGDCLLARPRAQVAKAQVFIQPMDSHTDVTSPQIVGLATNFPAMAAEELNKTANVTNMRIARDICLKHGYRLSLQTHKIADLP